MNFWLLLRSEAGDWEFRYVCLEAKTWEEAHKEANRILKNMQSSKITHARLLEVVKEEVAMKQFGGD